MTTFVPTNSGMFAAAHVIVPVAVPEAPVEVDQVTEVTPTLSEASPWNVMLLAVVEIMVDPGLVMRSEGGVVFPGEPEGGIEGEPDGGVEGAFGAGAGCVCAACWVTEIVWLAV